MPYEKWYEGKEELLPESFKNPYLTEGGLGEREQRQRWKDVQEEERERRKKYAKQALGIEGFG